MGEPSVEDTIAILRGLKPRYEAHHKGVKIKDSALVAAANLSHRYIADRFLPDKAIDLMDEATSRLAMELESVPQRNRRGAAAAGATGTGRPATGRRDRRARQAAAAGNPGGNEPSCARSWPICAANGSWKRAAWATCINSASKLAERGSCSSTNLAAAIKEKQSSGMPVGEADYQKLYELDLQRKKLAEQMEQAEQNAGPQQPTGRRLLRQEVGPEEIAEVVSAWTGIPVSRMMETERAKLLVHGRPHPPAAGQPGRGGRRRVQRGPPQPLRACKTRTGPSARSSSSAPPAWARPSFARPWPR